MYIADSSPEARYRMSYAPDDDVRAESSGPDRSCPIRCTTTHRPGAGIGPERRPSCTRPSTRRISGTMVSEAVWATPMLGHKASSKTSGRGAQPQALQHALKIEVAKILGAKLLQIGLELVGGQARSFGRRRLAVQ